MEPDSIAPHAARYAEPDEVEAVTASVLARLAYRLRRGFRVCGSCHEEKPPGAFRRDSTRRDGLYPVCRACEACKRTS